MSINGQWEGEIRGKVGHFPFTHVEFIDEDGGNGSGTAGSWLYWILKEKKSETKNEILSTIVCQNKEKYYYYKNSTTTPKYYCKACFDP